MTELLEYLKYSGPSTILVLVGLVWGKNLIKYFFDETIEIKKVELNHELEKYKAEIEQESKNFQHVLDTKLNEFNIRFSELHQERARIIKELYYKLIELHSAMYDFTRRAHIVYEDAEKEAEARITRLNKAWHDFNNHFLPNRIYFDKILAEKLNNLATLYRNKSLDFTYSKEDLKLNGSKEFYKESIEKIRAISTEVENDFSQLIDDIGDEFRKILGVD